MSHIVFHGGDPYMRYLGGKLVQSVDLDKGKRILDVGTGVGSSLIPAAMKTGREGFVIGIEIDGEIVEEGSRIIGECGLSNPMMMRMDAAHLAFKDNAFDCALSGFLGWDDIFNSERNEFIGPRNKMEEIHRILRKGGRVGISPWLFLEDTEWMGESVYAYLRESGRVEKASPLLYSKENEKGTRELLGSIGFTDTMCLTEHYSKKFLTGEEYWEKILSMGWQTHIGTLKLNPEEYSKLKEQIMQRIENQRQSDGFYFTVSVLYAFGTK